MRHKPPRTGSAATRFASSGLAQSPSLLHPGQTGEDTTPDRDRTTGIVRILEVLRLKQIATCDGELEIRMKTPRQPRIAGGIGGRAHRRKRAHVTIDDIQLKLLRQVDG